MSPLEKCQYHYHKLPLETMRDRFCVCEATMEHGHCCFVNLVVLRIEVFLYSEFLREPFFGSSFGYF